MIQGVAFSLATLGILGRGLSSPSPSEPDPEAGLNFTRVLPEGIDLNDLHNKSQNAVFAVDFEGLVPGSSGVIWESGGSAVGASLCVEGSNIVLRAGDGRAKWPSGCCYVLGTCPTGDGTIAWEINVDAG